MTLNEKNPCSAIILAAGKGKRMNSDMAKVLHPVCGRPMLAYSVDTALVLDMDKIVVVIGHRGNKIREAFPDKGLIYVEQPEQLGTGHAVLQARDEFRKYDGNIMILCGDVPLLQAATLRGLIQYHTSERAVVSVLTTVLKNPAGYGRIIKSEQQGNVLKIVEEKDATSEEKKIQEINTGIYCVESSFLFQAVEEINNENAQKEYYLTDIVQIAEKRGLKVVSRIAPEPAEVMGVNTPEELEKASFLKRTKYS
jgi:UDP-N-acetylglucosamine diphosphorylase/glucosamine-1-phosphate N-acetyltransferase